MDIKIRSRDIGKLLKNSQHELSRKYDAQLNSFAISLNVCLKEISTWYIIWLIMTCITINGVNGNFNKIKVYKVIRRLSANVFLFR